MLQRTSLVGIDIGSSAIKAVQLRRSGATHKVVAIGHEPLPVRAVVDGAVSDVDAVGDAVRRLFERLKTNTTRVATALSSTAAVLRVITVPVMSELELAASIEWEIEQHIPLDLEEASLDYQTLAATEETRKKPTEGGRKKHGNRSADPVDPRMMDVLVAAARKEQIARLAAVISHGGGSPAVIDAAPLALQNAYEANYGNVPDAVVVLIDAGASATTIHVVHGERMVFSAQAGADENTVDSVDRVFARIAQLSSVPAIDNILVTGGGSRSPGFSEALQRHFKVSVERFDPFRRITFGPELTDIDREDAAATSAVAVGLALRRVGDR